MRRHQSPKPMRRCISCRESKPQDELLRFTLSGDTISADTDGNSEGRGYYLCSRKECIENAIKRKAFNRACRTNVDADSIETAINIALDRQGEELNVKKS